MYASVEDNPYFLGVTGHGSEIERQTGADIAEYFISEKDGDSYILFTGGAAIGNEMHRLRFVGALEVFAEHFGDLGSDVEELAVTREPVRLSPGGISLTVFPGYTTREEVEKGAREELKNGDYDFALSMFSMYSMVDALKQEGVKQGVVDCYSMTMSTITIITTITMTMAHGMYPHARTPILSRSIIIQRAIRRIVTVRSATPMWNTATCAANPWQNATVSCRRWNTPLWHMPQNSFAYRRRIILYRK